MDDIRANLRRRRKSNKLTQKDVAELAEITRAHYTNIELGKKNPSYSLAMKLKDIMGYYDDSLFLNGECQNDTIKT